MPTLVRPQSGESSFSLISCGHPERPAFATERSFVCPDREILPDRPNLEQYKKQAKELHPRLRRAPARGLDRIRRHHPRLRNPAPDQLPTITFADAQSCSPANTASPPGPHSPHTLKLSASFAPSKISTDPLNTFIEVAGRPAPRLACLRHPRARRASSSPATRTSPPPTFTRAAVLADEATVRKFLAQRLSPCHSYWRPAPMGRAHLPLPSLAISASINPVPTHSSPPRARSSTPAPTPIPAGPNTLTTRHAPSSKKPIYGAAGLAQSSRPHPPSPRIWRRS